MSLDELNLYEAPVIPSKHDYGRGIVGAGSIVRHAHLPAYRNAMFNVVGIFDQSIKAAKEVATEFDVPAVYTSLEDLLEDPQVEIVDIAVPAPFQPAIAHKVIASGRSLLCQKPLAVTFQDAKGIVTAAEIIFVSSKSNPFPAPSRSMDVSKISPAPRFSASCAQASTSKPVYSRPLSVYAR